MIKVGDKAIGEKNVKMECPCCRAIQTEKVWFFDDSIYENNINVWGFLCFHCHKMYYYNSNGKTTKNSIAI